MSITAWAVAIYCVVGFVSSVGTVATMRGTHLGHSVTDTLKACWQRVQHLMKAPEIEVEYPPRIPVGRRR